jgi:hypothetical protein
MDICLSETLLGEVNISFDCRRGIWNQFDPSPTGGETNCLTLLIGERRAINQLRAMPSDRYFFTVADNPTRSAPDSLTFDVTGGTRAFWVRPELVSDDLDNYIGGRDRLTCQGVNVDCSALGMDLLSELRIPFPENICTVGEVDSDVSGRFG